MDGDVHLTLHLTDRCNLACRYCYQKHGTADMARETEETAIDRLATGNNPGVVFFGGEPLLRRGLMFALADRCEAREPGRFHYKVTTNGTLLDESFLAETTRRRLSVALSCNGVREAHDKARREALFLRNEAPKAACAGCALEGRCHNRCGCLNFQTTGGLETVPPILCEHARFLQPLCDELAATLYAERNPLFLRQHYNPAFPVLSILEDFA